MIGKKGRLLSLWWFFVLAIITAAVIIGVSMYYSAELQVKDVEADILTTRISTCLVNNGVLVDNFLNSNFDLYYDCGLNESVFGRGSNFFFKVGLYDDSGSLVKDIVGGQQAFDKDCQITDVGIDARHYPKCSRNKIPVVYGFRSGTLEVYSGSNQEGRVVPVVG